MTDDLKKRFHYQRPSTPGVAALHEQVSEMTYQLACWLDISIPPCRGLELALQHLEMVRMWANQAVAMEQAESPWKDPEART